MSEISAKMSEICYQIRLVYICASKLLDEALLVSHFFSMKTLAVTKPISTCTQGVTASLAQSVTRLKLREAMRALPIHVK